MVLKTNKKEQIISAGYHSSTDEGRGGSETIQKHKKQHPRPPCLTDRRAGTVQRGNSLVEIKKAKGGQKKKLPSANQRPIVRSRSSKRPQYNGFGMCLRKAHHVTRADLATQHSPVKREELLTKKNVL